MGDIVKSLFSLAEEGLKFLNHQEADSYDKKITALKERWYEEFNKDPALRSDAVLDNIQRELCIQCAGLAARLREQNAQAQS